MRQFYFVNEVGTSYFFDHRSKTLISGIDNIGYEKENTYITYDNSFKKVDERVPQKTICFSVVFLEGYTGYSRFLEYIRTSTGQLRLFYKIGGDVKFMYVAFKGITKTELQSGAIQSSLTLDRLSLWLVKNFYTIRVNENNDGKVFPFRYPFVYSSSFNGEITIFNNGEYKAALDISISGAVNNPEVQIIKDGVILSKLRLLVTSPSCNIEVNAEKTNQFMQMTENNTVENIYDRQDFSCDNFLFLPKGTYRLKFLPGVNLGTTCRVGVLEEYGGH